MKCLFCFLALAISFAVHANDEYLIATVLRFNAPDVMMVDIPSFPDVTGKDMGVRILGIDVPSFKGKCQAEVHLAVQANIFIKSIIKPPQAVLLKDIQRGHYFMYHAEVYINGSSLGDELVKRGLAKRIPTGKFGPKLPHIDWCEKDFK
ncbi:thermonuclease family protein [Photobacterium sagamiensis]|uniref:thermonuclease family protein n=1 Tax=Photobacterium sagamiensis TaxID=2910241 RepID=UPI003D0F6C47